MKIKGVRKQLTYYVTIDDPDCPDYITDKDGDHWVVAMGESWDPVYDDEKLKMMFLDYLKQTDD